MPCTTPVTGAISGTGAVWGRVVQRGSAAGRQLRGHLLRLGARLRECIVPGVQRWGGRRVRGCVHGRVVLWVQLRRRKLGGGSPDRRDVARGRGGLRRPRHRPASPATAPRRLEPLLQPAGHPAPRPACQRYQVCGGRLAGAEQRLDQIDRGVLLPSGEQGVGGAVFGAGPPRPANAVRVVLGPLGRVVAHHRLDGGDVQPA
mmetsp:Transcript_17574/g.55504  ORF Transcript_17574/g.55504 Transcript_17574/m.55504 type:complete len:202 (-) Transcript_17574:31-636(-)|eukprot:scaffold33_cov122-Isochrysis_galbana.AAC.3